MNIGNSIGTALFVNSDPNISAGSLQGMSNGAAEGSSGSLFQQLISRMLASQTLSAYASAETLSGGLQAQPGEGGDLTELLLSDGSLSGIGSQNAESGIEGLIATVSEQPEETQPADGSESAVSAIQALMGGLVSAGPVWNNDRAMLAAQSQPAAAAMKISAAAVIDGRDPGSPENQKSVSGDKGQSGIPTVTGNLPDVAGGPMTGGSGETGEIETAAIMAVLPKDSGKSAEAGGSVTALKGIRPQETGNSAQADLKAVSQATINSPELRTAEAGGDEPATAVVSKIREESAVPSDKAAGGNEIFDDGQLAPGYQIPVQGAIAAGEAAEQNSVSLTVDKAEPYSQIGDEILSKLEQKGPMEFKMQLEPEDLGLIDVKLKLSDGKLMIDILAANAKTQTLLTSQVDKLIAGMGLQNVQVESVQVNQQMNSQSQDGQSQNYSMNAGMDFSQRRQQEQFQGEFFQGAGLNRAIAAQQNETRDISPAGRIESVRYGSHRMDYTV